MPRSCGRVSKTFYHTAHHGVAAQVYPMAGVTPKDVDVFATYDSFSVHLLASLEGFGFCKEGEGGAFVQNGRIEIGGELPCNTSGGMLSESYMQSWNHQPELVRQLRGRPRRAPGARAPRSRSTCTTSRASARASSIPREPEAWPRHVRSARWTPMPSSSGHTRKRKSCACRQCCDVRQVSLAARAVVRPLPVRSMPSGPLIAGPRQSALVDDLPPRLLPGVPGATHVDRAGAGRRAAVRFLPGGHRRRATARGHGALAAMDRRRG